jgi:hypothetical protein
MKACGPYNIMVCVAKALHALHKYYALKISMSVMLQFSGAFIQSQKALTSFVMSIPPCLSACISVAATGWISVKFDTGDIYENLLRKSKRG